MRKDGYARIEDYALIGDGRTAALVAIDGAIDWLCLPNLDSPSVFGALLDIERGGRFELQPSIPFRTSRRYLPNTNVLETTFETDSGAVRLTDGMTLPDEHLAPGRELVRMVDGLSGRVPMRWRCAPRFDYGATSPHIGSRAGVPVATSSRAALALCHWNAGTPEVGADAISSTFETAAGERSTLALASAWREPLVLPSRAAAEARLEKTVAFWREWTGARDYRGRWADAVHRSALVLKLLIFAPSGASAAAPTTSLPEEIGGERNWDYRCCWIRDSNFIIYALLELGCYDEAKALFWWFLQATALTEPELHVLYRLDGGLGLSEYELPLSGYRGSHPVRVGNGAVDQMQLDIYGDLFETAWLYSEGHHALDGDTGNVLGRIADHVCEIWRRPDSGIWEVRNGPFHFTHSKVMCWAALDRAVRLAERGEMPARHAARWRREAAEIERFIETRCWSDRLGSYSRTAGDDRVDASLLMLPLVGYGDPHGSRINGTIDAVSRDLRHGDFVYRYHAEDGVPGGEGCFLNCSFWLAGALARAGRVDEATTLMHSLVGRSNDVGLYSEEVDPRDGTFLGNFPQALVHLALIDAAAAIDKASRS
jgi:GH15 family glucan-1,4-alpha-glucosidase